MEEQWKQILTAREAADYLRVSLASLHRMEKQGLLIPFRTVGGHRRYSLTMLNEYLEHSRRPSPVEPSSMSHRAHVDGSL
jgi:excisionase family DNA binding protein